MTSHTVPDQPSSETEGLTPRALPTDVLLEAAPDAIVIVGQDGKIRSVNRLTEQMFGYSRAELLGQPVELLVPSRFRQLHQKHRRAYAAEPHTRPMGAGQELLGRRKDASEFPVEISLSPLQIAGESLVISIIRDVTRLKQAEAKFRGLLESAPDGIVVVDARGTIAIVNSQTEEMFGYAREELIGQPVELLVPEAARKGHASYRADYIEEPKTRPMGAGKALSGRRKDGSTFPVEISLSPLHTEQGTLIMSIIRDITDRVRAEDERQSLMAARIRAEEMSRSKDQFLMTLSHELRTPLTSILGWSHLLGSGDSLPASVAEGIDAIRSSATAQARIIDDVIEISRMVSGKVELSITLTDPVEVLNSALQTVRPSADAKRIRIVTEIGPEVQPLPADPSRLQQIAWNLLSNAIKFSDRDSLVIVRLEQAVSNLELTVSDSGRGIDPSFLPYVFEPFLQADGSTTRVFGGLGLGLSIVRELVELHGGSVSASSAGRARGATFRVTIPVRATTTTPLPAVQQVPAEAEVDLRGMSILCVDDDLASRNLVRAVIARTGARVHVAESVREALALFEKVSPDVVVTDIAMPIEDGYALARQIRSRGNTPIVALTALSRLAPDDSDPPLFDRFLRKPASPAAIVAAIAEAYRLRAGGQ